MGFLDKIFGNSNSSKSYKSVQEYVYNIAKHSSDNNINEANKLCEEAKQQFPNDKVKFDDAFIVGKNAQDLSFPYDVSCPKCGTTIQKFVGYCPTCGHQYVKGDSTSKWHFETPQEYEYKLRWYLTNNMMDEADELYNEAIEHFPDNQMTYTMIMAMGKKQN